MPTIVQTHSGKVSGLWGAALIRGADGKMHALKVGDVIHRGDVILTTQTGLIEITPEETITAKAASVADDIDRVIAGINTGDATAATAAIVGADGAGELGPGLRVDRVSESVGGANPFTSNGTAITPTAFLDGNQITATEKATPIPVIGAVTNLINAVEQGPSVNLGIGQPSGASAAATVTVGQMPVIGQIQKADGTPVLAGGTLTVADLTGLKYVPPADYNGTSPVGNFGYTVSEGGGSASGTININLAPVNDAPVASAIAVTGLEDSTLPLSLGGTDVDGTVTGVTIVSVPAGSTLSLADGTPVLAGQTVTAAQAANLLLHPGADFNGSASVVFTVTDDTGTVSAPASIGITVTAVNDAPMGVNDTATTLEDSVLSGNVLTNDTDVDGPVATVTQFMVNGSTFAAGATAELTGVGSLVINGDGSYTFTPSANYNGPVPLVTYTLTDGALNSVATLAINVASVNDAPVAGHDLASTPINTPLTFSVLGNDSDVDGDTLTVTGAVLANPAQGAISVNPDGTLSFAPAVDFSGAVAVTYTVSDGHGSSGTANVTINVGTNTPPAGADSTQTLAEDSSYTVRTSDLGFADADAGQGLANVRIDALPATGTLLHNGVAVSAGAVISAADIAAGTLVFVPVANANGTPYASFSFSVQDSDGAFDSAPNSLTFNVTPVNDAPLTTGDVGSVAEDATLSSPAAGVLANDSDVDAGDSKTVSAVFFGTSTGTVGSALVGNFGTLTLNADGSYSYAANTAAASALGAGQSGTDIFTYTVRDTAGATSSATLSLTVNGQNDAASIGGATTGNVIETGGAVNAMAGTSDASGVLTVSDADAGQAVFQTPAATSLNGTYGTFTFDASTGAWTYDLDNSKSTTQALTAGQIAHDTLTVTSADGTASQIIDVKVTGSEDDASIAGTATGSVIEAGGIANATAGSPNPNASGLLTISDVDASQAVFQAPAAASLNGSFGTFTFNTITGAWTYALDDSKVATQALVAGQVAHDTLTVTSADGAATKIIDVTVNGSNDNAIIVGTSTGSVTEAGGTANAIAGTPSTGGSLNIVDVDFGQASFQTPASLDGTYGTFAFNAMTGAWTYALDNSRPATQAMAASGSPVHDTLIIKSLDGTATRTIDVTVNAADDAPVAVHDAASTPINTSININVTANDSDADNPNSALTVSNPMLSDPSKGLVSVNPDGTIFFQPINNFSGSLTITYTLKDPDGLSDTATVTVNVNANTPPSGTDFTITTNEDTPAALTIANFGFSDPDAGQTIDAVRIVTLPGAGTLLLNGVAIAAGTVVPTSEISAGQLVFSPAPNASGAGYSSFTFAVQDSAGSFDSTPNTATFNVTAANDAPVGVNDSATTFEDVSVSGNVLTNDTDVDGPSKTVTQFVVGGNTFAAGATANLAGVGTLLIHADGSYAFAPAANYAGAVPAATYTVSDGTLTSTATLTLTITAVNDAPTATPGSASGNEDTTIAVNLGGTDIDGTIASINVTALPVNGTLFLNDGVTLVTVGSALTPAQAASLKFLPIANFNGSTSFTFTVTDDQGATSPAATETINVASVNDAPTATPGTAAGNEDATIAVSLGGTDIDGTIASIKITSLPANGTLFLNDGMTAVGLSTALTPAQAASLKFVPSANFNGSTNLTFTVTDDQGETSVAATETISVASVNDGPTATAGTVSGNEDTTIAVSLGGTDIDGTIASINVTALPANGTLFLNDGVTLVTVGSALTPAQAASLKFVPTANFNGSTSFTFTVTDDQGATSPSATETINVASVNDAPIATASTVGGNEDTTIAVSLGGSDIDGTIALVKVTALPANGTLFLNDGVTAVTSSTVLTPAQAASLKFIPTANFNGSTNFTFTVTDDQGATSPAVTETINVASVNDVPTATAGTGNGNEDTTIAVSLGGTDIDGTIASIKVMALPANGTLFLNDGATLVTGGSALTPAQAASLKFVPTANFNGSTSFTFTVTDDQGATSPAATETINVVSVNDAPNATAGTAIGNEDTTIAVSLSGTDVDGTIASVKLSSLPANGTIFLNDGVTTVTLSTVLTPAQAASLQFVPTANFNGNTAFTFTVTDNQGATSPAAIQTITVNSVNDAPLGTAGTATGNEDTTIAVSLGATDVDGTVASLKLTALPANGTLFLNDGVTSVTLATVLSPAQAAALKFVPTANFNGSTNFTFTATDNQGAVSAATTETINVVSVNDTPSATAGTVSGNEDTTINVNLGGADIDGTIASVKLSTLPANGTMFLSDGVTAVTLATVLTPAQAASLKFVPTANFNGSTSFTFTVTDDQGATSPAATETINVAAVNDAPVATAGTATGNEDTTITVGLGGTDVDGTIASVKVTALPANGTLFQADGTTVVPLNAVLMPAQAATLKFVPTADFSGSSSVSFTVTDNLGAVSATAVRTITVTPVADVPVMGTWATAIVNASDDFSDNNPSAGSVIWTGSDSNIVEINKQSIYATMVQNPHTAESPTVNLVAELEANADSANYIATTVSAAAGQVIEISFDMIRRNASGNTDRDTQSFDVLWNGVVVGSYDPILTAWQTPVIQVTSIGGSNALEFRATDPTGSYGALIDNLSIATISGGVADTAIVLPTLAGKVTFGDITDNSEQHTLAIMGIPVGAMISDGTRSFTATVGNTSVVIFNEDNPGATSSGANWNLATLTVKPPPHFSGDLSLTATATAVELATGSTATASQTLNVIVADRPSLLTESQLNGVVAGVDTINATAAISQATLESSIGLSAGALDGFNPPPGPGTNDPDLVDVIDGDISRYTYTLAASGSVSFNWAFTNAQNSSAQINGGTNDVVALIITAPDGTHTKQLITSSEQAGASATPTGTTTFTAPTAGDYQFSWLAMNGGDTSRDSSVVINDIQLKQSGITYGTSIDFPVMTNIIDAAGTETLSVSISGLPTGAAFSAGTDMGNGVWKFTPAQLEGLHLLTADGYTGTVNLTVSASAFDSSNGVTSVNSQVVAVTVSETTNHIIGTGLGDTLTGTAGNDHVQGMIGNDTINAGSGNDLIHGADGADTLNGQAGNDIVYGDAGNDIIDGGDGNDMLYGGIGADVIAGANGNDVINGGAGNDTLTGGAGADVFSWYFADRGTPGSPAVDTVTDFNTGTPGAGGDVIDLRDLLHGESIGGGGVGNLTNYLHFTVASGTTTIQISANGGFSGGFSNSAVDQTIVLTNADLSAASTLTTDSQIIQDLLNKSKLIVDGGP